MTKQGMIGVGVGAIIILVIGILIGLYAIGKNEKPAPCPTDYSLLSRSAGCRPNEDKVVVTISALEKNLNDQIQKEIRAGNATHISAYFRDLNNNKWIGVNENENYAPGSLLKLPLMIAYFKYAESHPEILNQTVTYEPPKTNNADNLEAITAKRKLEPGKTYSMLDLIKFMMEESSNEAAVILYDNLDPNFLHSVFDDMQVYLPTSGGAEQNFLSAAIYSNILRALYNSSYLTRDYSEQALDIMSHSSFTDGLVKGMPDGTTIAHKFGDRSISDEHGNLIEKGLHDCGIIYKPNHPYILCIMTRGQDFTKLETVLQDISKLVYQSL